MPVDLDRYLSVLKATLTLVAASFAFVLTDSVGDGIGAVSDIVSLVLALLLATSFVSGSVLLVSLMTNMRRGIIIFNIFEFRAHYFHIYSMAAFFIAALFLFVLDFWGLEMNTKSDSEACNHNCPLCFDVTQSSVSCGGPP